MGLPFGLAADILNHLALRERDWIYLEYFPLLFGRQPLVINTEDCLLLETHFPICREQSLLLIISLCPPELLVSDTIVNY